MTTKTRAAPSPASKRFEIQEKIGAGGVGKVRDDGAGFRLDETTDGHGLVSMKQRARGLGGTLEIVSGENAGTTITLAAPLTANADEKVL